MRNLPDNYPNPYFHDFHDHKIRTITFICFAMTPTGRISKDFSQLRLYVSPNSKFAPMTFEELLAYGEKNIDLHKIPKQNKWGEIFIHHNFL